MSEKHVSDLLGCMIIKAECRSPRESSLENKTATLESLDNDLVSTRCQYEMNFLKSKVKSFLFEDAKSSDMFTRTLDECKNLQATLYSYRQPIITHTSSSSSSRRRISKIHNPRTKISYDDIRAISVQKQIERLKKYDSNIIKAEISLQKRSVQILRTASEALFECGARIHAASQSREVVILTAYWIESPNISVILRLSRTKENVPEILRASLHAAAPKHVPSRVSPSFQMYVVLKYKNRTSNNSNTSKQQIQTETKHEKTSSHFNPIRQDM